MIDGQSRLRSLDLIARFLSLINDLPNLIGIFRLRCQLQISLQLRDCPLALSALQIDYAEESMRIFHLIAAQGDRAGQVLFCITETTQIRQRLTKIEMAIC